MQTAVIIMNEYEKNCINDSAAVSKGMIQVSRTRLTKLWRRMSVVYCDCVIPWTEFQAAGLVLLFKDI